MIQAKFGNGREVYSDLNGYKCWHLDDKLHRENGPAVKHRNGTKVWLLNHKRHREDGPAIEWSNGDKDWYLDGIHCSESDYYAELKLRGIK